MTHFAANRRVFFVEEAVPDSRTYLSRTKDRSGVEVVVPHLSAAESGPHTLQRLLYEMLDEPTIRSYSLWYYTPLAMEWTVRLSPSAVIYDCMDELSAFKGAPPELREFESALLRVADVVFTGGNTLYEAKKRHHDNVYPFPSSIDASHFAKAKNSQVEPHDQAAIPRVRLGYAGVIDERMDLELLAAVADSRPDWHLVMLGPVVKIEESSLPRRANIHYLGMKSYEELPRYMSGWDVALLPFARNESTRFISPTKTPEYLAAGLPVVSTSIRDVIQPYGVAGVVHIADEASAFVAAVERALAEDAAERTAKVDRLLANNCWSRTSRRMDELMEDAVRRRGAKRSLMKYPAGDSQSSVIAG